MTEAILLDVGGPILDEDREYAAWDRFLLRLLNEEGTPITEEGLSRTIEEATRSCSPNPRVAAIWEIVRPDIVRFLRLKDELREFQRRHMEEEYTPKLRPGVKEVLEELAERYVLALAGNQPARIKGYLKETGILDLFDWKLVSEEMGLSKPDPLFFRMILDGLSLSPQEAVMVGDRLDHDVLPATLLGIHTVRVLVGPYREQAPPSPLHVPEATISSLTELPAVLNARG